MSDLLPTHASAAQRAFVQAALAAGATSPERAQPLTALPRLSGRELDALVATGLVREAAAWTYYVFEARDAAGGLRRDAPAPIPVTFTVPRRSGREILLRAVLWLALLLLPLLAVQFLNAS